MTNENLIEFFHRNLDPKASSKIRGKSGIEVDFEGKIPTIYYAISTPPPENLYFNTAACIQNE